MKCKKYYIIINTLSKYTILAFSKLIAFADDKFDVTQNIKFIFHKIQNIVGKGENAGYQDSLIFPQCFQKRPFLKSPLCFKSRHCVIKSF